MPQHGRDQDHDRRRVIPGEPACTRKKPAEIRGRRFERMAAERNPRETAEEQRQSPRGRLVQRAFLLLGPAASLAPRAPATMDAQGHAVHAAPDHEIPARAVPEAAQQHRDEHVGLRAHHSAAVASERDVQVIAEPGRETDVPATPELGDRPRDVRHAEVLRQFEAEDPRRADGHE